MACTRTAKRVSPKRTARNTCCPRALSSQSRTARLPASRPTIILPTGWPRSRAEGAPGVTEKTGEKKKLEVKSLTGSDIYAVLPDLARLRMTVFRDWPYLYDGTLEYEEKYLQTFAAAKGAVVIAAYDGN